MPYITIPNREDVVVVVNKDSLITHYAPKIKGQPCSSFYSKNFYKRTLCGVLSGLRAATVLRIVDHNDATCERCKAVLMSNSRARVQSILRILGREVVESDKRAKQIFDANSKHCVFRKKLERQHRSGACRCTNPDLRDKHFGWSCDIGNCPYMNRAMDWRANNL